MNPNSFFFQLLKYFQNCQNDLKRSIKKSYKNASSGRISNPLSIPPTTYARAILDEKVKKKTFVMKK